MEQIIETILKKDRFYVRVASDKTSDGTALVARAIYVWLKGNPSFEVIPAGYVIHHLDHDCTNDDISNLVLMCKWHHVAYHWKHKTIISKAIIFSDPDMYFPKYKPKVYFDKSNNYWIVRLIETEESQHKTKIRTIRRYCGQLINSKEEAEAVANEIWKKNGGKAKWQKKLEAV